jgi:outer membrane protein OmpA-like peptidoglycan-associated protein
MENVVRPDTIGKSEPIQARFELLPRGTYTYDKNAATVVAEGPKVSMDRYESLLAVYQAQNAVQIARSQGADKYAADTLAKAESLLAEARQMEERRLGRSAVVTAARQAAQTAEDARMIAIKRSHDSELASAHAEVAQERARREEAERTAQRAQAELESARAAAANAPQNQPEAVIAPPPPPVAPRPQVTPAPQPDTRKAEARVRLQNRMNSYFPTVDTPRGLVITLHDRDFRGPALDPAIAARVANLASAISGQRGLSIEVEGHGEQNSSVRAAEVRDTLVHGGLPVSIVTSRGLGPSRPMVASGAPHAAEQNRRVEIIISGESIGTLASWDRTYPLR